MKWTFPSANDKRGFVQREIKWNFKNTYTCSTFPFTVSVFFAPPRFGSWSTERELQAICASDSVVKGTEISLKRREVHIWTHCTNMDKIKLYLETTIQIKTYSFMSVSSVILKTVQIWVLRAQRSGKSPAEGGRAWQLTRAARVFPEFQINQLLAGYNLLSPELKNCFKQCPYNVW